MAVNLSYIFNYTKLKQSYIDYLKNNLIALNTATNNGYSEESIFGMALKITNDNIDVEQPKQLPALIVGVDGISKNNEEQKGNHTVHFVVYILADSDNAISCQDRALAVVSDLIAVSEQFDTDNSEDAMYVDSVEDMYYGPLIEDNKCLWRVRLSIKINTKQKIAVDTITETSPQGAVVLGVFNQYNGNSTLIEEEQDIK